MNFDFQFQFTFSILIKPVNQNFFDTLYKQLVNKPLKS